MKYSCKICNKSFSLAGLSSHVTRMHVGKEIESLEKYYRLYMNPNWKDISVCKVCGINLKFRNTRIGYKKYCSHMCANNDNPNHIKKLKQYYKDKYNTEYPSQEDLQKEKELYIQNRDKGKPSVYICKICKRDFSTMGGLTSHLHFQHINKEIKSLEEYYQQYIDLNWKENNTCRTCGKKTKFHNITNGYKNFCNSTCINKNEEKKEKVRQTNLDKYGVSHNFQREDIKENIKKTNLEKYGYEYACQSELIKERMAQTNLKRRGVRTPFECKEVLEKSKITNLKKYGTEFPQLNPIIKQKKIDTCQLKYGADSPLQSKLVHEKIKSTNLKNLGVEYPFQSKKIIEKVKLVNLNRYGFENPMHNSEIFEKQGKARRYYPIKDFTLPNGNIITYQSKMELKFIKDCIESNIEIEDGDIINYRHKNKDHKYFVDFKIKIDNKWRLIEIKGTHKWYYEALASGVLEAKNKAVKLYR